MQDEAFHEIQLNGKQLVFLFMAATVVAVVIFLSGVLVGRGVQTQRASEAQDAATEVAFDPTAQPAPSAPADGTPVTAGETLTYADRLRESTPRTELLTPPVGTASTPAPPQPIPEPAVVPPPAEDPAPTRAPASTPATPRAQVTTAPTAAAPSVASSSTSFAEPAGNGFVVQVAAVRERAEAEVIARRLGSKGYSAFVSTPAGAPGVFRVRVGKFDQRREAEAVAGRLEREEQFRPWITR